MATTEVIRFGGVTQSPGLKVIHRLCLAGWLVEQRYDRGVFSRLS